MTLVWPTCLADAAILSSAARKPTNAPMSKPGISFLATMEPPYHSTKAMPATPINSTVGDMAALRRTARIAAPYVRRFSSANLDVSNSSIPKDFTIRTADSVSWTIAATSASLIWRSSESFLIPRPILVIVYDMSGRTTTAISASFQFHQNILTVRPMMTRGAETTWIT